MPVRTRVWKYGQIGVSASSKRYPAIPGYVAQVILYEIQAADGQMIIQDDLTEHGKPGCLNC